MLPRARRTDLMRVMKMGESNPIGRFLPGQDQFRSLNELSPNPKAGKGEGMDLLNNVRSRAMIALKFR